MGLSNSRLASLPSNIDDIEVKQQIISNWRLDEFKHLSYNISQKTSERSTLGAEILSPAGKLISKFFSQFATMEFKILEIMCGNGIGTSILYSQMSSLDISKWMMTDLFNWNSKDLSYPFEFEQLNSVEAVGKYGVDSNVLLIISPPPAPRADMHGFGDYYACHDFISQTLSQPHSVSAISQQKFIIFVGELGASDGSEGMYKYLLEHVNLNLVFRDMISLTKDIFGGNCEKELFIFEIRA
jgi:hypothetical protein